MFFNLDITVGSSTLTDLVYADDTALLLPSATDATTSLKSFSDCASHLELNISWSKTKLKNTGSGPKPPNISVDGNVFESVDSFVYPGSLQSSGGQCRPDVTRRISLACAVCSHDVSKTDMERQAPDTRRQAPYIPLTHVARLDDDTPANMALQLHTNVSLSRPPDRTWRRPHSRPRNKWLNQLRNDSTRLIGDLWRRAVDRGHGGTTTRRPSPATRP